MEDEHVISDREKRAWQKNKQQQRQNRPVLDEDQIIVFLDLVASLSYRRQFEETLGLSPADVTFYKNELGVESQRDARALANKLAKERDKKQEAKIQTELALVREAEAQAQARLDELNQNRVYVEREVDVKAIREKEKIAQEKLNKEQSEVVTPDVKWQLPLQGNEDVRQQQIDKFRRDIIYRGLGYVRKQHGVNNTQIKYEAGRLGLKINWGMVRK